MTRNDDARTPSIEDRYRLITEQSSDMISIHDPLGVYTWVSPSCRRLLGYEPDELVGVSAYTLFHPDDLQGIRNSHGAVLASHEIPTVTYRIKHREGHWVWFETTSRTVRDDDGGIREIITNSRDVTDRVEAMQVLQRSEERFRLSFEFAGIGKALVGLDGRFLRVNDVLCDIVGYPRDELIEKTFQQITHPDDLDADLAYLQSLVAGDIDRYEMEKRYFHSDGRVIWVLLTVSLVRDEDRAPVHFIAQIQDITERRRVEQQLRSALADVRRLSGMLPICAHCKNIRDDEGYWQTVESYLGTHSEAEFSHGLCPDCLREHYGEVMDGP